MIVDNYFPHPWRPWTIQSQMTIIFFDSLLSTLAQPLPWAVIGVKFSHKLLYPNRSLIHTLYEVIFTAMWHNDTHKRVKPKKGEEILYYKELFYMVFR